MMRTIFSRQGLGNILLPVPEPLAICIAVLCVGVGALLVIFGVKVMIEHLQVWR